MCTKRLFALILIISTLPFQAAQSEELLTNCARFANPPKWVHLGRVNRIAESVSRFMEWNIRRVEVIWYNDQSQFEAAHGLGPLPLAITRKNENKILLGPKVVDKNFDQVFGHELVHVSASQKYKDAIPKWLEEGVANYVAKMGKVDYQFMASQPALSDVRDLAHPVRGTENEVRYRYMASQALTEMIASKCDFTNLLRLSVQRKLENYLENICRISDINASFAKWIKDKSGKK